ncbi:MAG: cell division protein ZapA [Ferruginibacter sp.]
MSDLIPINIIIADRTYRVKTNPEDEEVIRKTLKVINDKIIEFKTQFSGKDMQDYIAMVVIWYATQATEKGNTIPQDEINSGLARLEQLVDKALTPQAS